MKITYATRIDFDGDDSNGGFSVIKHFLINDGTQCTPDDYVKCRRRELRLEFCVTDKSIEWTVERRQSSVWESRMPDADRFSEKTSTSFADVLTAIKSDEREALFNFLDYVIENLEEEVQWDPHCEAVLDEVMQHRDSVNSKEVKDLERGLYCRY